MVWKRTFLISIMLTVVATGCSDKKTTIQGTTGGNLPNNGFPRAANARDVTNATDPAEDWGFYTGQEPGRHDPFVDLRRIWAGTATFGGPSLSVLEEQLACGPAPGSLVVCPDTAPIPDGWDVRLFSLNLGARVPLENTSPEDSGRYSLFFDYPEIESTTTPDAPDLASNGADLIYELVYGAPGGPSTGVDPDSIELSVLDYRTDTFPETSARVWLHGRFVTWMVPLSEIQGAVGVRGGAFWGNALDQGDPALGNADVVPGGVHAPYGFLPLDLGSSASD